MMRELLSEERRTKIRKGLIQRLKNRRFWRNSGLLMAANIIVTALGLIRTPAITWLLPKDEVGMISVVGAWLPFLQLLSLSGLDASSYHYSAKGQHWAFVLNQVYRLRWSLLSSLGFLAGAVFWFWSGNDSLGWLFIIAGVSYPVTIGLSACSGQLGATENFPGLFLYRLLESLTDFAGFIPLLLSTWLISRAVTFYGFNQLATAVMMIGYSIWLVRQVQKSNTPQLSPQEEREILTYGKHLTVMNAIGVTQTRADAVIIGSLFPLSTMADYSIALLVYEQFKRLWNVYGTVRYPILVKLPLQRRFRRFILEGVLIFAGFSIAGIVLSGMATWLIPIVLPASYASSLGYMYWLVGSFVAGVPGFMAEIYFRTEQDQRRQYVMRIAAAIVAVVLPLFLVRPLGAYGVVFGRFLGAIVLSVLGVWLAAVHFRAAEGHPPKR